MSDNHRDDPRQDDQQVDPEDFVRYSLSRRNALMAAAGVAAGALGGGVLAACSSGGGKSFTDNGNKSTPSSGTGGNDTGNQGGGGTGKVPTVSSRAGSISPTPRHETVIIDQAIFTVFNSFNPFIPNGEQYNGGLGQVCREYLWYFNMPTGETIPWLATKWEYDKDFKTFTIHLNPKAHWNDGKPFTSKDVVFTLQLLLKNKALLGRGPITDKMKSISATDAHTVVVKLKEPDPRYHYNWICGIVSSVVIVPEHVWGKQNPTKFKNNPPVYTGPYKLKGTKTNLKMYIWQKDPNYWNSGKLDPKPKYVVYRTAPTAADADVEQFTNAATDIAGSSNIYQLIKTQVDKGYKNAIILPGLDPCPRAIWINCDKSRAPLDDPRMRYVISALIDRKKIATSIWQPETTPAVYPWAAFDGNKKWENDKIASKYQLTYDPDKAKQLLDEIGAKADSSGKRSFNGKPLKLEIITTGVDPAAEYLIGQLLVTDLKNVGIDASIRTLSSAVYNNRWTKGDFDLTSQWLCGEVYDPWQLYNQFNDAYYVPVGKNANVDNQVRLKDPTFTKYINQLGNMSPDAKEAKPVFNKALNQFYKDLPVIPTIQTIYASIYNTTFWTGWPTADNVYQVPSNWWGQWMFVIGKLQPTGAKVK